MRDLLMRRPRPPLLQGTDSGGSSSSSSGGTSSGGSSSSGSSSSGSSNSSGSSGGSSSRSYGGANNLTIVLHPAVPYVRQQAASYPYPLPSNTVRVRV